MDRILNSHLEDSILKTTTVLDVLLRHALANNVKYIRNMTQSDRRLHVRYRPPIRLSKVVILLGLLTFWDREDMRSMSSWNVDAWKQAGAIHNFSWQSLSIQGRFYEVSSNTSYGTVEETWAHETKLQSKQWKNGTSLNAGQFPQDYCFRPCIHILAHSETVLTTGYLDRGKTVTDVYNTESIE